MPLLSFPASIFGHDTANDFSDNYDDICKLTPSCICCFISEYPNTFFPAQYSNSVSRFFTAFRYTSRMEYVTDYSVERNSEVEGYSF